MKAILSFFAITLPFFLFSQCGIYLTAEDYQKGKLTDESDFLSYNSLTMTPKTFITVKPGGKKKKYTSSNCWGFRSYSQLPAKKGEKENPKIYTDSRIIKGRVWAIFGTGTLYSYRMGSFFEDKDKKLYFSAASGINYISFGPLGECHSLSDKKDLAKFLKVDDDFMKKAEKYDGTFDGIILYYNSVHPLTPPKKTIE